MAKLISPTVQLHASWLDARDEWGRGVHQDGTGLRTAGDVDSPDGFAAWVDGLHRQADESIPTAEGLVHSTYWWIVDENEYLGGIALRHDLDDFLLRAGGHIGYSVRPSARRRGLATWALGMVLGDARTRGMSRVLITCRVDNPPSAHVIKHHGGVLEDVRDTELGRMRRYWISLTPATI